MDTDFTRRNAGGVPHAVVSGDAMPEAFCRPPPPGFDTAAYTIRPFPITATIRDGYRVDLGGRVLEVLSVPGHTPDAVALRDSVAGYLWTGDTFYEAPIWLWFPETDWAAYARSVDRLAALAPGLTRVFGAHNTPVADPEQLLALQQAVAEVRSGRAHWEERRDSLAEYPFRGFSVLTRKAFFATPGH